MISDKEIKKNLKFIGITLLCGVVLIFLLFRFESNPFKESDFDIPTPSLEADLRNEISAFTTKSPFTPADYPILLSKINSAGKQGLIQASTENELIFQLTNDYKDKAFRLCDGFLTNCSNDLYDRYQEMLTNLEKRIGRDAQIDFYRQQIQYAYYYDVTLPNTISQDSLVFYTYNFFGFDYCTNENRIKQLDSPSLNPSYLGCRQYRVDGLKRTLENFRTDYIAGPGWLAGPFSCP